MLKHCVLHNAYAGCALHTDDITNEVDGGETASAVADLILAKKFLGGAADVWTPNAEEASFWYGEELEWRVGI